LQATKELFYLISQETTSPSLKQAYLIVIQEHYQQLFPVLRRP
jgi:hypothetical protein